MKRQRKPRDGYISLPDGAATRLKTALDDEQLSQAKLERMAKIRRGLLSRWIERKCLPSDALDRICDVLGRRKSWVMIGIEPERPHPAEDIENAISALRTLAKATGGTVDPDGIHAPGQRFLDSIASFPHIEALPPRDIKKQESVTDWLNRVLPDTTYTENIWVSERAEEYTWAYHKLSCPISAPIRLSAFDILFLARATLLLLQCDPRPQVTGALINRLVIAAGGKSTLRRLIECYHELGGEIEPTTFESDIRDLSDVALEIEAEASRDSRSKRHEIRTKKARKPRAQTG